MAAIRIYQIIRDLIKDPQSLINYVEDYLLKIAGLLYVTREINSDIARLMVYGDDGNAELSINHEVRIRGRGKVKDLVNALILRYLGTDGVRRITILLIKRKNRIYRVNDLPRAYSPPVGLIWLMLISIMVLSIIIAVLRIVNAIPSLHLIIVLLLSPLLIPIIYSYILRLKIRRGDLRNAQIIKFVLEYGDFDEKRFNEALRLLSRIENIKSLNEIRRFLMLLVSNSRTRPQNFYEEEINVNDLISRLGIRKNYGIYLVNVNQCNAASIGLPGINYIILTSRLLSCLSTNELIAVIMHEVGHIVHGDSAKALFLISLVQLVNIALITYIIPLMSLPAIPIIIVAIFFEIFGMAYIMKLSEYSADKYALKFVPKRDLAMALIRVTWKELHNELVRRRFIIFASHPPISSRLARIIR
ncbi:M48 family metalloprotease [Vulcanisaeta sp. JCM 16159]|uniref:M48 family metalloprotease n=1 Tax=Vulcanisaeta sp. JCM 16159 TaxID=1295371 RepID=UPI0006D239BC|nr:M48 family metallopeptidase [Vulcanisaeta sp. JCM 16159]